MKTNTSECPLLASYIEDLSPKRGYVFELGVVKII